MKVLIKSVAIAAACFSVGALAVAFDSTMRVTLESKNGGKVTRWIGDIRSVSLDRTLSDKPCRQGRSWGYDKDRLWVDDGCRGTFTVRRGGNGNDNRDRGRGRNDGRLERKTVKIESVDGKRRSRVIQHEGRVTLIRKLSDKPCIEGRSWGQNGSTIWVDRGCRGEFEYFRRK